MYPQGAGCLGFIPARVPLSQMAKLAVVNGQSTIARRENRRQIAARTHIAGSDRAYNVRWQRS